MANTTQILDDGLQLDLSSLSLRAENSPAEPPSLQLLNPFQDLLDLHQDQDQIEAYLRQHLQPYLDGCQTLERLAPDNPFFQQVRDFWEKEGLEGNGRIVQLHRLALWYPKLSTYSVVESIQLGSSRLG